MKIKRILFAAALIAGVSLVHAQEAPGQADVAPATLTQAQIQQVQVPAPLYKLVGYYREQKDLPRLEWTLERLVALEPNNGQAKLALATSYALAGDKSKTYDTLLNMQKQGFGYDLTNDKNFEKVTDTRVWKYVVDNLNLNLKLVGEGKVAYTLPGGDHLYDAIAFDPKRKQLLIGSVREGTVSLLGKDGQLQTLIKPDAANGLWSVYAMAVDADSDTLYVASTASVYYKGFDKADFGKAGVFKFNLTTGKLVDKYLLLPDGEPRTLSSIAAGKNGKFFVADGLRNTIFRLDGGKLKPMLANPRLTSIRGLALTDDGKRLYFADYNAGVFGIDLAAGKAFDLAYDGTKLVLGGVDGLNWYDGTLVVIENGMSPARIMRIHFADDGRTIKRTVVLDAANPALTLATYGAVDGDGLYTIANSQKNKYGTYGTPEDGAKLEPVRLFRSNLRYEWDAPPPRPGMPAGSAIPPLLRAPAQPAKSGLFGNVESSTQSVPAKQ